MRVSDTSDKCFTCQLGELRDSGVELTRQESNHWSMWGCTCDPEDAENAMHYIDLMTR